MPHFVFNITIFGFSGNIVNDSSVWTYTREIHESNARLCLILGAASAQSRAALANNMISHFVRTGHFGRPSTLVDRLSGSRLPSLLSSSLSPWSSSGPQLKCGYYFLVPARKRSANIARRRYNMLAGGTNINYIFMYVYVYASCCYAS